MLLSIIIFLIAALAIILTIGIAISAPRYQGPVSDHFDGKRFHNPAGYQAKGFSSVLRWMVTRKREPWAFKEYHAGPKPVDQVTDGMRITFINHTTFLIQVDGVNILTDPVWSERVSPFSFAGPRRMRQPGIKFEDLPQIHLVLLSHNHYDHLDVDTLRKIYQRFRPTFITPLGVGQMLNKLGIETTPDLDWWSSHRFGNINITAVPAQHFSGRGMADRDATLWCGYVLNTSKGSLYFAGDTGYHSSTFNAIGERIGPFDVSIIPIGAYQPIWFMSPIHCSPAEAVKIHNDVKSKLSIASHFGTFPLADEGADTPVNELNAALLREGISKDSFIVPQEGQPIIL